LPARTFLLAPAAPLPRPPIASVRATDGELTVIVKITPNDKGNPPGKLADAELHFTEGVLEGLKLIGFSVWERRSGNGRNVTFPARQYSVNGERRSFSLLRPIADATSQDRIREAILQAYAEHEENEPGGRAGENEDERGGVGDGVGSRRP
jgi:hypothetical protein